MKKKLYIFNFDSAFNLYDLSKEGANKFILEQLNKINAEGHKILIFSDVMEEIDHNRMHQFFNDFVGPQREFLNDFRYFTTTFFNVLLLGEIQLFNQDSDSPMEKRPYDRVVLIDSNQERINSAKEEGIKTIEISDDNNFLYKLAEEVNNSREGFQQWAMHRRYDESIYQRYKIQITFLVPIFLALLGIISGAVLGATGAVETGPVLSSFLGFLLAAGPYSIVALGAYVYTTCFKGEPSLDLAYVDINSLNLSTPGKRRSKEIRDQFESKKETKPLLSLSDGSGPVPSLSAHLQGKNYQTSEVRLTIPRNESAIEYQNSI